MRKVRDLRDYIIKLETVAYGLRNEAMLRNSPHADRKIDEFDALVAQRKKSDAEDAARCRKCMNPHLPLSFYCQEHQPEPRKPRQKDDPCDPSVQDGEALD